LNKKNDYNIINNDYNDYITMICDIKVCDIKVCVIGVGYVGEQLVNVFKNYYNLIGVDISEKRVNDLNKKYNDIKFQTNYNDIEKCDVFLISVPTLVDDSKDIDISYLLNVKNELNKKILPGKLVVIESSVYVGATREIFGDYIINGIYVGFSPERVDPGRVEPSMEQIPKIVSGLNDDSLNKCINIYEKIFDNVIPVSSTECAEMCKLYENCFRMINIAYVNEISDMCESKGINVNEMINASATKPFGFMPFYPGIGVGGHCIPVNPYYLMKNGYLPVLKYCTKMMENRPKMKTKELISKYPDCNNILIMGIGFKKGEKLLTNSPGYELYKNFIMKKKNVFVYDSYVENENNDIRFLSKEQFILNKLLLFDLIIIVHTPEIYERNIINKYIKLGHNVYSFAN